jgi:transitional endoplasmic reticulum ATPase
MWHGQDFLLYEVEYTEYMRAQKLFFVLYPGGGENPSEEKDSPIDALLLAVGAWTNDLHEEIYVFDDSYWAKSKELWTSVQGVSWVSILSSLISLI